MTLAHDYAIYVWKTHGSHQGGASSGDQGRIAVLAIASARTMMARGRSTSVQFSMIKRNVDESRV